MLGVDAGLFHLSTDGATVPAFDVFRLKVTLAYDVTVEAPGSVDAYIRISCNESDALSVPLYIDWDNPTPTQEPTQEPTQVPTEAPTESPADPTQEPTVHPTEELRATSTTNAEEAVATPSGPTSYPETSDVELPNSAYSQQASHIVTGFLSWAVCCVLAIMS
ncbi:hypothetical protein MHU86_5122 [Fragilaria crotonensis]|nr:hypothetical protein MHU86_5122 [Fragilaria crotonensis]